MKRVVPVRFRFEVGPNQRVGSEIVVNIPVPEDLNLDHYPALCGDVCSYSVRALICPYHVFAMVEVEPSSDAVS